MSVQGPQDTRLDRRSFLERMGVLTSLAATGGALAPGEALGAPLPPVLLRDAEPARGPVRLPEHLRAEALARLAQVAETAELTLAEASSLIREGRLTPLDLVESHLGRIDRFEAALDAFNLVRADESRAEAERLGRAPWRGALHGIPLAIKDNYYTAGIPTTANSHIFADFIPEYDATAVARLKEAGGIVLGKTQMGPLATTAATTPDGDRTTVNAWAPTNEDVSPGGSSSGSATAVAARLASSSTGTQTGGSITSPSSAQGLTGLKPTMGRVSLYGIIPLTYTRDHPGPIARDALDAALMLQVMAGPDPHDPRTLGLPPVPDYAQAATPVRSGGRTRVRWPTTVGVIPDYTKAEAEEGEPPQDETEEQRRRREERAEQRARRAEAEARARVAMLQELERLGARVVEVQMPEAWDALTSSDLNNVRLPERTEPFLEYLQKDVRLFGVSLSPWINGMLLPGVEYLRGQRAKMLLLRRLLDQLFTQCDVVVQTEPFPFDMVGLPLIAFPIGFEDSTGSDTPIGGMLGARPFGEERLLAVAAAYQDVTEWHRRKPADPAPVQRRDGERPDRGRIDVRDVMELGE